MSGNRRSRPLPFDPFSDELPPWTPAALIERVLPLDADPGQPLRLSMEVNEMIWEGYKQLGIRIAGFSGDGITVETRLPQGWSARRCARRRLEVFDQTGEAVLDALYTIPGPVFSPAQ